MKHLGDICKINGLEIAPVDVIIGGSPCQDLSSAGKKAGLVGERSGLFMEQIRIIKEMRAADEARGRTAKFIRPRFMVWENVPGAFSSNKGEDFRIVLEETAKIVQPDTVIPRPTRGWRKCGCILGRGWSIAWRVLDAQFWGVPQRRRRIVLVADFGGGAAPEILFERKSLSGDTEPGGAAEQEAAGRAGGSAAQTGGHIAAGFAYQMGAKAGGIGYQEDMTPTLKAEQQVAIFTSHDQDSRYTGPLDVYPVCSKHWGTGGNNIPLVMKTYQKTTGPLMANSHPGSYTGQDAYNDMLIAHTLRAQGNDPHREDIATYPITNGYVRRLTPLECERLQGYPDGWTDIGTWRDSKGKLHKDSSDTARYKVLGNSIALPPWRWVLLRLSAQYYRPVTMGSLFDGIGGFPLIWEQINGKGSCLWASEVEEFCIAVTKRRFGE